MDATIVGLIIGVVLVIITLLLIFWGNKKSEPTVPVKAVSVAPPAKEFEALVKADDLIIIEGIGPKIAGLLNQAGIKSFAQLATVDLSVVEKLLKENGLQFVKFNSWPEQARLAAEGKMDELKALQEKLVAGR